MLSAPVNSQDFFKAIAVTCAHVLQFNRRPHPTLPASREGLSTGFQPLFYGGVLDRARLHVIPGPKPCLLATWGPWWEAGIVIGGNADPPGGSHRPADTRPWQATTDLGELPGPGYTGPLTGKVSGRPEPSSWVPGAQPAGLMVVTVPPGTGSSRHLAGHRSREPRGLGPLRQRWAGKWTPAAGCGWSWRLAFRGEGRNLASTAVTSARGTKTRKWPCRGQRTRVLRAVGQGTPSCPQERM
jgi:hypothetical protein